jgi:hypothetical protein
MLPPLRSLIALCAAAAILAGCGSEGSIKPSETLDEHTGMTVGSLEKPIELVQSQQLTAIPERCVSFAYLGPVEWDNMGKYTYGLWVQLAPSNDVQFDDIQTPGNVHLALDDGSIALRVLDAPETAHGPYRPVASWGQIAYFELDVRMLQRMAASQRLALDFKAVGGAPMRFSAAPDAHEALLRYLHARGY